MPSIYNPSQTQNENDPDLTNKQGNSIAIVGASCRFPGKVNSLEEYWDLLSKGRDGISTVPENRWDKDSYYSEISTTPGKINSIYGGFLEEKEEFDPQFFGISPKEAHYIDPQHRILLELVWEAFENGKLIPENFHNEKVAVYVGISSFDYANLSLAKHLEPGLNGYVGTGTAHSPAAGRISYHFGFKGPSLVVDTACSSALVALHQACNSLRNGEANAAIVGAVNRILTPAINIVFSKAGMLSKDGRCKTFDASADGYGRSEGAGVVILKRLEDALNAGDEILGIIRGSSVNQDGASGGLTVPNGLAQTAVIEDSLKNAGINPSEVSFLEAHGTGTSLGDPIEIDGLRRVFEENHSEQNPLYVSSSKTNLGHMEAAAGMGGLLKILMQFKHRKIAPHLHFKTPNPNIQWEDLPFKIPTELKNWNPGSKRRIAGLSSFGFSGTNANIILEEPLTSTDQKEVSNEPDYFFLPLSAKSKHSINELVNRYHNFLIHLPEEELSKVCYTATCFRTPLNYRLGVIGKNKKDLSNALSQYLSGKPDSNCFDGIKSDDAKIKVAFMFAGQGSQYISMGTDLYQHNQLFKYYFDQCNHYIIEKEGYSLWDIINSESDKINQTEYSQPVIFSFEYALAKTLMHWDVIPSVMLGHSVGEYVAACIAGVFSLHDGLKLITARGKLMQSLPTGGGMMALNCDLATSLSLIKDDMEYVSVAAENGINQTVISGDSKRLERLGERCNSEGIHFNYLNVSHAFHSPLMKGILQDYYKIAETITYYPPKIKIVSNISGEVVSPNEINAEYWKKHILSTVKFYKGINTLLKKRYSVFLEISPKPVLTHLGKQCDDGKATWISIMSGKGAEESNFYSGLAKLFVSGIPIKDGNRNLKPTDLNISLPNYPFAREKYWIPFDETDKTYTESNHSDHEIMELHLPKEENLRVFEISLKHVYHSFLKDHQIDDMAIFPAAGYFSLAVQVLSNHGNNLSIELSDAAILAPLRLNSDTVKDLQICIRHNGEEEGTMNIFSKDEVNGGMLHFRTSWKICSTKEDKRLELVQLKERIKREVNIESLYTLFNSKGLNYGKSFKLLKNAWQESGEAIGYIRLNSKSNAFNIFHPALMDNGFHLCGIVHMDDGQTYIPTSIKKFNLYNTWPNEIYGYCYNKRITNNKILVDITYLDLSGLVLAEAKELCLERLQGITSPYESNLFYDLMWKSFPAKKFKDTAKERQALHFFVPDLKDKNQWSSVFSEYDQRIYYYENTKLGVESFLNYNESLRGLDGIPETVIFCIPGPNDASLDLNKIIDEIIDPLLSILKFIANQSKNNYRITIVNKGSVLHYNRALTFNIKGSGLIGLIKTFQLEYPAIDCRYLEVDADIDFNELRDLIFTELSLQSHDKFVIYKGNERLVQRLANRQSPLEESNSHSWELTTTEHKIESLKWIAAKKPEIKPKEVKVEVFSVGLNFKDVLFANGTLKDFFITNNLPWPGRQALGLEFSGVIQDVGKDVKKFRAGDKIIGQKLGCFQSVVHIEEDFIFKKPASLSFCEAATIPTVFLTAHYAICELAKLKRGERILIHAAAGGVGQAAIQIARRIGAEIYATASKGKWDFLRQQGINYIYDSRTLAFSKEILRDTNNQGVNVVLNSLNGEYIQSSFDLLEKNGRFIEIGKVGIWSSEKANEIRPDVLYKNFDLSEGCLNTQEINTILNEILNQIEGCELATPPVKSFAYNIVQDGFKYLGQAKNVGKVSIQLKNENSGYRKIYTNKAYIVTGGLGALGFEFAKLLARLGAGTIYLLARNEHTGSDAKIKSIEELGASVQLIVADVSRYESLSKFISCIKEEKVPLGGILHTAGVLDDGLFQDLSIDRFEESLSAKLGGAYNLHRLTLELPSQPDFFISFSSIASILGSPGQANYATANSYLDGFMVHRHMMGLPGLSVNWGPWAEVGMASSLNEHNQSRLLKMGILPIRIQESTAIFEELLKIQDPQVLVNKFVWNSFLKTSGANPIFENYLHHLPKEENTIATIVEKIKTASHKEGHNLTLAFVKDKVGSLLGFPDPKIIDNKSKFYDLGIDSLMTVDLRNTIETNFGIKLSFTSLFDYPTLETMANHIYKQVGSGKETQNDPKGEILEAYKTEVKPTVNFKGPFKEYPQETERENIVIATRHEMKEIILEKNGKKLCVCSWGDEQYSEKTIVCIHGILDQGASWIRVAEKLSAEGNRVIAPDLRGHGRTPNTGTSGSLSLVNYIADLKAFLPELLSERFCLAGHSMGGAVASLLGAVYPEMISSLILIEPAVPYMGNELGKFELIKSRIGFLQSIPEKQLFTSHSEAALRMRQTNPFLDEELSLILAGRILEPVNGGYTWTWDPVLKNPRELEFSITQEEYGYMLKQIKSPIKLMFGSEKNQMNTEGEKMFRHFRPDAEILTIDGGHNLHFENPDSVAQEIIRSMSELD